jgi:pilus assembly protein Flp/PilA
MMCRALAKLVRDQAGVTAIEYGLIATFIAIVCVVVWGTVGTNLQGVFSTLANDL